MNIIENAATSNTLLQFWLKCIDTHISENISSLVTHYLSRVKYVSNTHYTENMFDT